VITTGHAPVQNVRRGYDEWRSTSRQVAVAFDELALAI
jgi:hypothetical protein